MGARRVVVVGAGMGGLACAIDLARRGAAVTVLERAAAPGGKMREVLVAGRGVDAGPTVFTMRWIFESLFRDAGAELGERLSLRPAAVLARHAWRAGGHLDLYADLGRSAQAIEAFAGRADAAGYRDFCARSAAIYRTLRDPFIGSSRPSPLDLVRRVGWGHLDRLWQTAPLATLWSALSTHFRDPRLRQLFGRYATYVGSSPFRAPATLMLIAHVEQDGVWLVEGGMRRVADALSRLAVEQGATVRCRAPVARITTRGGRVAGVALEDGEELAADAVVFNGEMSALGRGLLGPHVCAAARPTAPRERSLSALTWCLAARTRGFALSHHNVFFAEDYAAEFAAVFERRTVVDAPTVYVCAQDRADEEGPAAAGGAERLLLLINAPADGDSAPMAPAERARLREATYSLLSRCGLHLEHDEGESVLTTPAEFEALFPGSGGALYGRANHGPWASFARPGCATRIPGLYLAGGSAHPGPGIPMATMSGRLAAVAVGEALGLPG